MPHEAHSNDKWVERNRFQFGNMEIFTGYGRIVEVRAGAGPECFTGDMRMAREEDISSIQQTVLKLKHLEKEQGDQQVSAYRKAHSDDKDKDYNGLLKSVAGSLFGGASDYNGNGDKKDTKINLLIEIVSQRT